MPSNQASQLRLAQRPADGGSWVVPEVRIEESSMAAPDVWVDASSWFNVIGLTLTTSGHLADFRMLASRTSESAGSIYRLVFTEDTGIITFPQIVGEMAIVSTDVVEEDRTWAIYPIVGTPEGRLETIAPYTKLWPSPMVGDVLQFYGTWFI